MDFEYRGKFWMKEGFRFPDLRTYIETTRERLSKPLQVPPYATAGEEKRIQKLSRRTEKDPYLNRTTINEQIRQMNQALTEVRGIPYEEHPVLYEVCMFAARELMDADPMIFLYATEEPGLLYNAFAVDHQDKVWIYVSTQFFREHGMLSDGEMCFLVGHELGHAHCHHSTLSVTDSGSSDDEYSADRAGMIACTKWILDREPECPPDQAARRALMCGAAVLKKLTVGSENGPGNTDWSAFSYEELQMSVDRAFQGAAFMALRTGSHPTDPHRVMAMVHFSQSQMLYRCLGLEPGAYRDLLTDAQLHRAMASQLTYQDQEEDV